MPVFLLFASKKALRVDEGYLLLETRHFFKFEEVNKLIQISFSLRNGQKLNRKIGKIELEQVNCKNNEVENLKILAEIFLAGFGDWAKQIKATKAN